MRLRSWLLCVAAICLVACTEEDKEAPPAPNLDPVETPTAGIKQTISGSAEFGSTVRITGGKSDVEVKADQFTARFRAEVELKPDAENKLSVTATDKAGNVSEPATVAIVHQTGYGYTVKVSFTQPEARAGEAVGVLVRVEDAKGREVTDAQVVLESSPRLEPNFSIPGTSPAVVKPQGIISGTHQFVAYELSSVASAGYEFSITARLEGSQVVQGSGRIAVKPAPGNSFSQLAFTPSGTSKTVSAGQEVEVRYQVVDLYGNPTVGPTRVVTNAPGAIVVDDGVSGAARIIQLTTSGTYTVGFYIGGVGQKGSLQLSVNTAPAAFLDVVTSSTLVGPNTDVKALAQVRDTYGNRIACTPATVADVAFSSTRSSGGTVAPVSVNCFNSAFEAVFRFASEDNYAIQAEYRPGGAATGVLGSAFVTVLAFDNTPPTVAIKNLLHDGVACPTSPAVCTIQQGEFIQFVVEANDNKALSEVSYTAFFSTAGATGSLRNRTVLVPSDAALPLLQPFSFNTPGAFIEDVPLTAMAVDAAGNRATSAQYILRMTVRTYNGRGATLVLRDTGGNVINNPEDVAVAANGDVYVSNTGNNNILRLDQGSSFPTVYANTGFAPGFLTRDGASGNLYVTDAGGARTVLRLSPGTPVSSVNYVQYGNGANLRGLAQTGRTAAKGIVNVGTPVTDGDRVTIGSGANARVYEVNSTDPCPNTSLCLNVGAAPTAASVATALADCINSGTGCTQGSPAGTAVTAHPDVTATLSLTPTPAVILAAKVEGKAGNLIGLGTNACPRFQFNNGTACPSTVTSLLEGHDATFYVGQEAGNAPRSTLYRFPFDFTSGFPKNEGNNEGAFDMSLGGTDHTQWGLAAKTLVTPSTRNLRDFTFYFPDVAAGTDRLRAVRWTDAGPGAAVFNSAAVQGGRSACGDCIRGTNDPAGPLVNFNRLWDVALEPTPTTTPMVAPNGCLVVSDDGNGDIYTVDTRDPTRADPLVSLVASGLGRPRGLDFGPDGSLYVALRNANAIVKFSPSPDAADCF